MRKVKVKINDYITFQRKGKTIIGVVEMVRDNSVIVDIPKEDAEFLDYETTKTVVNHNKYNISPKPATA